MNLREISL